MSYEFNIFRLRHFDPERKIHVLNLKKKNIKR